MDLRDLMNNDAAPARPPSQSQQTSSQRGAFHPPPPPPLQQQRSSSATYLSNVQQQQQYHHQHQQAQPPPPPQAYYQSRGPHPSYPHDARASNASLPSTPMALNTPQQQYAGAQYPFPAQSQQHSPSQVYPQVTPRQQSHPHYSHPMSPTPPTTHRSPQIYPPPHSQPSTPLGPPMQPYSRQSSAVQVQHQRTVSGASYPSQHHHSIASQSPVQSLPPQSAYPSESPHTYSKRPSIDYPTNLSERDRSLSVSPKTKVVLPTRQNSTDSTWMARERYASNEPRAAQRSSIDQAISPLTTSKHPKVSPSQPRIGSQTPGGLRNILNDDPSQQSPLMVSSPAVTRGHSIPPPPPQHPQLYHSHSSLSNDSPVQAFHPQHPVKQESHSTLTSESLLQQPIAPPQPMSQPGYQPPQASNASRPTPTLKRPAESEPERTNPLKKTKKRYNEPPVWARYAAANPRYDPEVAKALGPPPNPTQAKRLSPGRPALQVVTPQQQKQHLPSQQQLPPQAQSNGHAPAPVANGHGPMGSLGPSEHANLGPWEASIRGPYPTDPFAFAVGKYLFEEILSRPDVGVGDARNGALEIEAKLGTLVERQTDQRIQLPVISPTVLARHMSANLRFESHMTEVS